MALPKILDKFPEQSYTYRVITWTCSSAGSASVSLLCPTELWAFKWGVCRLVAQPSHAPKYGPIAQLGERSVRIREVKGSNPSRSTNLPHRFVRCGVFYVQKTLADRAGLRTLKSDANRAGSSIYFFENPSVSRFFLCILQSSAGKHIAFMPLSRKFLQKSPHHRRSIQP